MNKKRGIDREGRGGENNTKLTLHCRGERRELMHVCWEFNAIVKVLLNVQKKKSISLKLRSAFKPPTYVRSIRLKI